MAVISTNINEHNYLNRSSQLIQIKDAFIPNKRKELKLKTNNLKLSDTPAIPKT